MIHFVISYCGVQIKDRKHILAIKIDTVYNRVYKRFFYAAIKMHKEFTTQIVGLTVRCSDF